MSNHPYTLTINISEEAYTEMYNLLEEQDICASYSVQGFLEEELNLNGRVIVEHIIKNKLKCIERFRGISTK